MAETTQKLRDHYRGMIGMLPTGTVIQVDTNEFLQILADADRCAELEASAERDMADIRDMVDVGNGISKDLTAAKAARDYEHNRAERLCNKVAQLEAQLAMALE